MLSKAEKDFLIDLLEKGQSIPEDFRHKLFPVEHKEYELAYAGKMRREDLLADDDGSFPVPLQVEKIFNGAEHPAYDDGWKNMIVFGDNLQFLKTIYKNEDPLIKDTVKGKVKLVYIDPPFATSDDFQSKEGAKAYTDKKKGSEFIEYIRRRLILIREVLSDDGCIFVHLDWKKAHYIKVILDEVFGEAYFVNEIIWHYPDNFQGNVNGFANNHNVIFWYSKSGHYTANKVLIPLAKRTMRDKRVWSSEEKKLVSARDENGKLIYEEFTEKKADDVWDIGQSSTTKRTSTEFIDYPTQKPEELIRRIILAASSEGDIVMDCFAGSGTTAAVAEKLGRRWILCDIGKLSHYTSQKRMLELQKSKSLTKKKGKYNYPAKTFMTCSLGTYDLKMALDMEFGKYKEFVSGLFNIDLKQHKIGGYPFDGKKDGNPVVIFNYNLYADSNIDDSFLGDINTHIGNRMVGGRVYIVSPSTRVDYITDYEEVNGIRYYFLKIPYQIIKELHQKDFKKFRQPRSKADINALDESIGFSFNRTPVVCSSIEVDDDRLILLIHKFSSEEPRSGKTSEEKTLSGFDLLSAVYVDRCYNGKEFIMVLPSRHAAHGEQKSLFSVSAQQDKRSCPLPRPGDFRGGAGRDAIRNSFQAGPGHFECGRSLQCRDAGCSACGTGRV